MAKPVVRGAKLFPVKKSTGVLASYATAFIYEPEEHFDGLGELFAAIEVLDTAREPKAIADLIIDSFAKGYYEAEVPKDLHGESESTVRFDFAVKATNQALSEHTREDSTWIGKTSALVAIVAGSELHLTQAGFAEAHLLRQGKLVRIDAQEEKHQTHRPFTGIASGRLDVGDKLLLTTSVLPRILAKDEMATLLGDYGVKVAAEKIGARIEHSHGADRAAAVIAEVLSPDAAATDLFPPIKRQSEPIRREGSQKETSPNKASHIARNLLSVLIPAAKRAGSRGAAAARSTKERIGPHAKRHSLKLAAMIRKALANPRKYRVQLAAAAAGLLLIIFLLGRVVSGGGQKVMLESYDQALASARIAQEMWLAGDRDGARDRLEEASRHLGEIQSSNPGSRFERALARRDHPEYDPASLEGLANLIRDLRDQIDGLSRVSAEMVADLAQISRAEPRFLEITRDYLVVVGGLDDPVIATVRIGNGQARVSGVNTDNMGRIVATAARADGEGVYLLSSEPGVWLFRPSDNSLSRQNVAGLRQGRALASYAGNLYVLVADRSGIDRHAPAGNGFGAPTGYLQDDQLGHIGDARALAVDGSVITVGNQIIHRFFQGRLAQSASNIPDSYSSPRQVHSVSEGSLLLILDSNSRRAGAVTFDGSELTFSKQYLVEGTGEIESIASADGVTVFALTAENLVRFTFTP